MSKTLNIPRFSFYIIALLFLVGVIFVLLIYRSDREPIVVDDVKIIAEGYFKGRNFIYIMDTDGSNRQLITEGSAPAVSPDGRYIAYVATAHKRCLHIISVDGTEDRCLTEPTPVNSPAWSPDGRYITFTSFLLGTAELFILSVDGSLIDKGISPLKLLTRQTPGVMYPAFSPDGEWIYYNLPYRHRHVMRVHISGMYPPEAVAETGSDWFSFAVPHPYHDSILFSGIRSRRLYQVDLIEGTRKVIFSTGLRYFPLMYPRWSQGGESIVFCGKLQDEENLQIYFFNIHDLDPKRVTNPREKISWRSPSFIYPSDYYKTDNHINTVKNSIEYLK